MCLEGIAKFISGVNPKYVQKCSKYVDFFKCSFVLLQRSMYHFLGIYWRPLNYGYFTVTSFKNGKKENCLFKSWRVYDNLLIKDE